MINLSTKLEEPALNDGDLEHTMGGLLSKPGRLG